MLTTTTKVDHTIHVHIGKEVVTPGPKFGTKEAKANETVQFSSKDGEIKIHFPGDWPFAGDKHDIHGSDFDQKTGDYTSEILALKAGDKGAKFDCHIKPPGSSVFSTWEYGGEIQPRGK
jgi:hypothetical protein